MSRYFIEVSYKGTNYSGFQIQQNANTIQAEVEKALEIVLKKKHNLVGSSRTDAGVHACQNFFHFDSEENPQTKIYNLNALLPACISVKNIFAVPSDAHSRFDALSREYHYYVYNTKNPFLSDRAYYFPYKLNIETLNQAAQSILNYQNFAAFSKRNTQVKTFLCDVYISEWQMHKNYLVYKIIANRFLRGMVRGIVSTTLLAGRNIITLQEFKNIIENKDCTKASFSAPAQGLFLINIKYKPHIQFY